MKIAMVGMYGGMWGEFNPGCFIVGLVTYTELKKRLPSAQIDIYCIDNKSDYEGIRSIKKDGLTLRFFSAKHQKQILLNVLPQYDAIVFGGDIIWGGDDVVKDNMIFFAGSPLIPQSLPKKLLFNSVHTFYNDTAIKKQKSKFLGVSKRARYISVRTPAILRRLHKIGIKNAVFVPDPALLFVADKLETLRAKKSVSKKKIIGISIRNKLAEDVIRALPNIDFGDYKVEFFSFSKQYSDHKTVAKVKRKFGDKFIYDEKYKSPLHSFLAISRFDLVVTDKYHAAMAAAIFGIPFISIDVEPERTSRKQELFSLLGLPEDANIRLKYFNKKNHLILQNEISKLLPIIKPVQRKYIQEARVVLDKHFKDMADIIGN